MKLLVIAALIFFAAGCGNSGGNSNAPFTNADFAKLHWVEGTWRGTDGNGANAFFERIRFIGNDRIEIDSLADASSGTVTGQSSITFSAGSIFHQNAGVIWEATRLTDTTVEFVPKDKSHSPFTWQKVSADAWTATMAGKVYKMERVK